MKYIFLFFMCCLIHICPGQTTAKKVYENGDVYEGEWKNGYKHGNGKMAYANGDVYEGEWKWGYQEGKGKMTYKNGDVYDGGWNTFYTTISKYDGLGEFRWANGDYYKGEFYKGNKEGSGRFVSAKGIKKEGKWKEDLFIMFKLVSKPYSSKWKDHGKYQYALTDTTGAFVVKFKTYDYIRQLTDAVFEIRKGKKTGLYDAELRKEIVPFSKGYEYIEKISGTVFLIKSDRKYSGINGFEKEGLYDASLQKEIIPLMRGRIELFGDVLMVGNLEKQQLWFIDKQGRETGPVYEYPGYWPAGPIPRPLRQIENRLYAYVTNEGKRISDHEYESNNPFVEGYALIKLNGKYGMINVQGKPVIEAKYDFLTPMKHGITLYKLNDRKSPWGILDANGNNLIPAEFDDFDVASFNNYKTLFYYTTLTAKLNGVWVDFVPAALKPGQNLKTTPSQAKSFQLCFGNAADKNKLCSCGYKLGNDTVLQAKWANASDFIDGWAVVGKPNPEYVNNASASPFLYGVIDKKGEQVIPFQYDYLGSLGGGCFAFAMKKDKQPYGDYFTSYRIINIKNDTILKTPQRSLSNYSEGLIGVPGLGYIDATGKLILPSVHQDLSAFNDGIAIAKDAAGYFWIEKTGKELFAGKRYARLTLFHNDTAQAWTSLDKWNRPDNGLTINRSGKIVWYHPLNIPIPPTSVDCDACTNGLVDIYKTKQELTHSGWIGNYSFSRYETVYEKTGTRVCEKCQGVGYFIKN